jgi:hypothetical protein
MGGTGDSVEAMIERIDAVDWIRTEGGAPRQLSRIGAIPV